MSHSTSEQTPHSSLKRTLARKKRGDKIVKLINELTDVTVGFYSLQRRQEIKDKFLLDMILIKQKLRAIDAEDFYIIFCNCNFVGKANIRKYFKEKYNDSLPFKQKNR